MPRISRLMKECFLIVFIFLAHIQLSGLPRIQKNVQQSEFLVLVGSKKGLCYMDPSP